MTGRRRRLFWPVVVGLLLRLAWWGYAGDRPLCEDCRLYDDVGWHLAQGRGFVGGHAAQLLTGESTPMGEAAPEAGQGPLYATVISGVYKAFGHDPRWVLLLQAVLSTGLVAVVGEIGGAISAWVLALWWPAVVYPSLLLTETLFGGLLLLSVYGPPAWAGAAALCRPEAFACWPVLFWRRRWRSLLVATLLVLPWVALQAAVFGRVMPVSAEGGEVLYEAARGWDSWQPNDPELRRLTAGQDYIGQTTALGKAALARIVEDPAVYVWNGGGRLVDFVVSSQTSYGPFLSEPFRDVHGVRLLLKVGLLGLNTLLFVGGAALLAYRRRWRPFGVIVAITLVHVVFYSSARFQVPVLPLVAIGWGGWGHGE